MLYSAGTQLSGKIKGMPFELDPKYVQHAEQQLGVTFPSMFRGKMIHDNGGEVEAGGETWWLHPFLDTSDRKRLSRTCNDIVRETTAARQQARFASNAVAIGHNGGGDYLVLLPKPDQASELSPAVFRWDHETGEMRKLAEDFHELLSAEDDV